MKKQIIITNPDLINNEGWLPTYHTDEAAAIDLRAMFDNNEHGEYITLHANESILIPAGFKIDINDTSTAGVILPKSGLGSNKGIICGNCIGLIDSDYLGEIFISVWNRTDNAVTIKYGDRITQMIFVRIERYEFEIVKDFDRTTKRNEGGFGHTGAN